MHALSHSVNFFGNRLSKGCLGNCESFVFCNVSARSRHFVNVDVIFLPSVCDSFCVTTFSLGQGCRSVCHELYELYEQSTVMFCRSGRDACFTIVCILCADHVFWYPCKNSTVLSSFLVYIEEYVLLSALLHDQSCLQSSPPFFSKLCL